MRQRVRLLVLLLASATAPAMAQDDPPRSCQAHIDGQWQLLGTGSVNSCLKGVDRWVPDYNAQGFKFGLWGDTMLSADQYYYYNSDNGGQSWNAVGLKADLAKATDPAPELPGPGAASVVAAIAVEAEANPAAAAAAEAEVEQMPAEDSSSAVTTSPAAAAPAASTKPYTHTAPVVAVNPALVAASASTTQQPTSAPRSSTANRRSCSLHVGGRWQSKVNLTIEQCAAELDKSPNVYDSNGFKYAYWSGVFLAANKYEVLQSPNSGAWQVVIKRQ